MQTRRSLFGLFLGGLLAVAAGCALWAAPAQASTDPQEFIATLGAQALQTLTGPDVSDAEREQRFRELFLTHFDVKGIGRTALGKNWRTATPEEQAEYLQTFEDFIVKTYAARFKQYSNEQFEVTGIKEDRDGYATVQSLVETPSGEEAQLLWRVRSKDGQLKIVDVVVEGVSMLITQQRDFASVVQQNGGQVGALIAELRQRADTMQ
jgi:phospholipid transport system substrate-binding protein